MIISKDIAPPALYFCPGNHLDTIFDQIQSLQNAHARAKGLTIEVDQGDELNWLRGDATRLRQALLNYVSNAIKFTAQGPYHCDRKSWKRMMMESW